MAKKKNLKVMKKKHGDKRRTEIEDAPKVVAKKKGKKSKPEAAPKPPEPIYKPPKGEVRTGEAVQVLADAIDEIYREFGSKLDRINCEDKALNLVRDLRVRKIPLRDVA